MGTFSSIYTDRLILREFDSCDWQGVHGYLSDPDVLQYMEFYPGSEEQSQFYVNTMMAFQEDVPRKHIKFIAQSKDSGVIIGESGLFISDHDDADICFRFNKTYWGRGYATEAAKAILEFGFERLRLHRISAACDIRNTKSINVMERIGMQKEGCLREHKWVKDEWRTSVIYSILEHEFMAREQSEELYAAI